LPGLAFAAMSRFRTNPWDLAELLALLDSARVVLPEFQRNFVWWPKDIDLLLTSLAQDFPAGSLLFLRTGDANSLAWRPVAEVEARSGVNPDYLVLDGQQRLTSLSLALHGRGDHLFFMDLPSVEAGNLDDGIYYLRRDQAHRRKLHDRTVQFERHTFPLGAVFGGDPDDEHWFDDYAYHHHREYGAVLDEVRSRARLIKRTYVDPLKDYRFPVVELPADTSLEAVCQIFETLNKTGMKLTVFDLLTAKFWPKGLNLREMLDHARATWPLLGGDEFDVESTYLLQAISLLRSEDAPKCKRGDLLQLEPEGFADDWKVTCEAASAALRMLRDDCGVASRDWLPYVSLFPSLFAAVVHLRRLDGPSQGAAWAKARRWFWCSCFAQRYEGPPNTLNATDFRQLLLWFGDDDAVPDAVAGFEIEKLDLRTVRRQRSAVYRSVICLTIVHGARDFHTQARLTAELLRDPQLRIEDHHIVPTGYLKRLGRLDGGEDSILNRCLIDAITNKVISDKAPATYLAHIADVAGEDRLEQVLRSHFIPGGADAAIRRDPIDLGAFLKERERLIVPAIAEVSGAELPQRLPDDVVLDPARPYSNELALRRLVRSLHGRVFWYEQHMDRKVLEILADELDRAAVTDLRLLSGPSNISAKAQRAFERFDAEMAQAATACEWRVLPAELARGIHARVIFDDAGGWELPPLNSLLKGTVDSIHRSSMQRDPFEDAWRDETAVQIRSVVPASD
jgi:hypothetical protein